jgi:hypothetical protein
MATLQSTDVEQARRYFEKSHDRVIEVTSGLSDAQWQFKPALDRWSIAEILEHMTIIQERVLGRVQEQLAQAPPPSGQAEQRQVDAIIFEKIPERSMKANAPEPTRPTGRLAPDAALERFRANYQRLTNLVESSPDLRQHVLESAPLKFVTGGAFQMMDGYQWALTVAAHDLRHAGQMAEVKEHP